MTWNNQTYPYGSQLTTIKMSMLMENFASIAQGDAGAPRLTPASLGSSIISTGKLKTATASGSVNAPKTTMSGITYTLAGGNYSWWTFSATQTSCSLGSNDTAAGVVGLANGGINDATVYFDENYIQSSPPYDLGDGEIPLFVFVLMNKDGSIAGCQIAPDPPWANNGPTNISPLKIEDGKRFRRYKRLGFGGPLIGEMTDEQKLSVLRGEKELVNEWVEITQEWKNRDRSVVPHPFGVVAVDQTVVLLDSFSSPLIGQLAIVHESVGANETRGILLGDELVIDNERTKMLGLPQGVIPVRARLKLTGNRALS